MRVVLIGASTLTTVTAQQLLAGGHEVVVIEKDPDRAEAFGEELDCSVVVGDGSRPSVLEDVDPANTDVLFCLSNDDTANILAAVVARSLDFGRVVLRIEDAELVPVCEQLKLENVLVPDLRLAEGLVSFVEEGGELPQKTEAT